MSFLSLRSAVINVSDLERSSVFYRDVLDAELLRDSQVAIVGRQGPGGFFLYLRQAGRHASHPGQQALGPREVAWTVDSSTKLDRVEAQLRAHGAFQLRRTLTAGFELVLGHDPDRLPLMFVADETGADISPETLIDVAQLLFSVDV
jgi:catechol 2,3-dioxygenase-like lactoylglutathione lyase family enzyme